MTKAEFSTKCVQKNSQVSRKPAVGNRRNEVLSRVLTERAKSVRPVPVAQDFPVFTAAWAIGTRDKRIDDSGNSPLMGWKSPFHTFDPGHIFRYPDDMKYFWGRRPRKQVTLTKSELPPIVLDDVIPRKRLSFRHGTEQIEIGRFLKHPDREWFAAVTKA